MTGAALSASLVLAACGGNGSSKTSSDSSPSSSSTAGRTTVSWFVGLGAGSDASQVQAQQAVVEAFNRSQTKINLRLTVASRDKAAAALAAEVANGTAPDIVGPVGIKGATEFEGKWLDLGPLIASQKFDTSVFDDQQLRAQQDRTGAQVALPFAIYPSMLFFNKDIFDKAKMFYPPKSFNAPYAGGGSWTMDKLRSVAMKLTLDSAGRNATDSAFDPTKIVQWGFDPQGAEAEPATFGSMFGAGRLLSDDGTSAQIPTPWISAWQWYYNLIWKDHAAPNSRQLASAALDNGNAFASGHVAMTVTDSSYLCCLKTSDGRAQTFWDLAAIPSFGDKATAPLQTDSFRIFASSQHPTEAFQAMSYLLTNAAPDLLTTYAGLPANSSLDDNIFTTALDKLWTQRPNWEVAGAALEYADVPNHDSYMPNFAKSAARVDAFGAKLVSTPGLSLGSEVTRLQKDLQALFAAAS